MQQGVSVEATGRSSALVVPLAVIVIAALFALGYFGDAAPSSVALMASVPAFAAIFVSMSRTAVVVVVALAAGALLAWLKGDVNTFLVALAGVAVASVVALLSSRRGTRASVSTPDVVAKPVASEEPASDRDRMTGLLNRGGAVRVLGAQSIDEPRLLAFLDCDQFEQVNAAHGTEVGDEFLQAISGRLRHSLPSRDTVARWEGDEFLVVLTADAAAAVPAVQRLADSIAGHPIRTAAGPVEASVSVGAASWLPGQSLESVIARAGRALNTAKAAGNGKVVLDEGVSADPR